jgi:hypothetical protein
METAKDARGDDGSISAVIPMKEKNNADNDQHHGIIENRDLAKCKYTSKHLYALNACRDQLAKFSATSREANIERYKKAADDYDELEVDTKSNWEMVARQHDEQQPTIKRQIIEAIRANPKVSWQALEETLQHWCSATTIWRWVTSFAGYKCYCERVIPLLSAPQKRSHLQFAHHFRNNWGLGGGKYLVIMYDEKWFWGLVTRRGAKCCDELGINQQSFKAYHKCHINKVMAIAFTAFALEDSMDNGGVGEKLKLIRAQGKKVASKTQRKAVRQLDGSIRFNGEIIRNKGDVYNVDCAVTGSNSGTSASDPKCPLLPIFLEIIFPMIHNLIQEGGKYEGYTPIIQGDNAGPHQDAAFLGGVKGYCGDHGWHWEPQAAQMPHMNVLDLSVFPNMSRRHIKESRKCDGLKVLSEAEIWENAKMVWNELPNHQVASAYIQAHRIGNKVIKAGGDNNFLGAGGEGIHTGITQDFSATPNGGMARNDKKQIRAP